MTNNEAIERIEQNKAAAEFYVQMLDKHKSVDNELKDIEAFNMAIEALSNANKRTQRVESVDLISRQDAIDAFNDNIIVTGRENANEVRSYIKKTMDKIKELPYVDAVQIPIKLEKRYPQSRDEDITDAFMRGYLAGRSSADRPTEWIPVSEKLPKEGQKIIFTEHDHYAKQRLAGFPEEIVGVGTYFSYEEWNYSLTEHMAKKAEKEGFGRDHVIVHGRRYNVEESEITAWMPMPEPYREDDEA